MNAREIEEALRAADERGPDYGYVRVTIARRVPRLPGVVRATVTVGSLVARGYADSERLALVAALASLRDQAEDTARVHDAAVARARVREATKYRRQFRSLVSSIEKIAAEVEK